MRVRELRRYPVKAMGGESLDRVMVDERGLQGDRWFAVEDAEGHFASGKSTRRFRRRDAVFAYRASTVDGRAVVARDGASWTVGDPALDAELSAGMGTAVRVRPEDGVPHQDDGQVSIIGTASLAWCERDLGVDADRRRLRANVLINTDEPFIEETWIGRLLEVGEVGDVRLRVVGRIERCRTVDLAQDGVASTTQLLKGLARAREACLGVYADVVTPGELHVGDPIQLTETDA